MNNFDSLMGILAGLNMSSVDRLRFSNLSLNDASVTILEALKSLMDPRSSWKSYRALLTQCAQETNPTIPYMYAFFFCCFIVMEFIYF